MILKVKIMNRARSSNERPDYYAYFSDIDKLTSSMVVWDVMRDISGKGETEEIAIKNLKFKLYAVLSFFRDIHDADIEIVK